MPKYKVGDFLYWPTVTSDAVIVKIIKIQNEVFTGRVKELCYFYESDELDELNYRPVSLIDLAQHIRLATATEILLYGR